MSQTETIYKHLKRCTKRGITSLEAFHRYGITRLAARIQDVRKILPKGERIESDPIRVKTRSGETTVSCYRLARG